MFELPRILQDRAASYRDLGRNICRTDSQWWSDSTIALRLNALVKPMSRSMVPVSRNAANYDDALQRRCATALTPPVSALRFGSLRGGSDKPMRQTVTLRRNDSTVTVCNANALLCAIRLTAPDEAVQHEPTDAIVLFRNGLIVGLVMPYLHDVHGSDRIICEAK